VQSAPHSPARAGDWSKRTKRFSRKSSAEGKERMQHLDEGTIHAWLDDALPPDEAARVAEHVKTCRECADAVADARGLIAGASRIVSSLDVVRGGVIPAAGGASPAGRDSLWRKLRLTPSRAAIAALLLVGIASMFSV